MTRRSLLATAAAIALIPATAGAASGSLAQQCAPAGPQAQVVCYGGDVLTRDAEAYAQPGRFESAFRAYERSWTHRALGLQYSLAGDVGMVNAPWLGTHNSFNSIAEMGPSLSDTDANQQLRLVDQLRLDMRSLELDVHWFPSLYANGQYAPVVCHAGAVSEHDGCSVERTFGPVLDEIAGWLHAHPGEVLLLYVEDHIGPGHDVAAQAIQGSLGKLVYGTGSTGGSCVKLPDTLSRSKVLAAGAQVVIVAGGCGSGAPWRGLVYDWSSHVEEGPRGFKDFPDCGPSFTRSVYDTKLVRYFEDSTWLSAGAGALGGSAMDAGLTAPTVAAMMRCGVDLLGFDQLTPDGRLDALVWSWAKDQPSASGDCAAMGADGRWSSRRCRERRSPACRASDGSWVVPKTRIQQGGAATLCNAAGATFAVPRTGYENELLKAAAGGSSVWLGYQRIRGSWSALDRR